jgi:hypothetical protein
MAIEIDSDSVRINGVRLYRPDRISPSQWLTFWERVKRIPST